MSGVESIQGRREYLQSPFLTAGDRVYLVGHQNGQFPDLGWHIAGEMGGIWDHPIKLMDGFTAVIHTDGNAHCLSQADTFINYPFANKHVYAHAVPGLRVERFQFVPDGKESVVIEYTFINKGTNELNIQVDLNAYTDLRPTWLGERSGMVDGDDHIDYDAASGSLVGKDTLNAWYVIFGSDRKPATYTKNRQSCQYAPAGKGSSAMLSYQLSIPAAGSVVLPVYIAGSYQSLAAAKSTFADVQGKAKEYLLTKKDKYEKIAERAKLSIPDEKMEQAYRWVKYNTEWLVRDVPEQGRGLSAGIPDYPWWFGVDNEYALKGLIATGDKETVYNTIALIHRVSEKENGNGRIIHEVSTNGAVFNPGNINETPQFVSLIWHVYQWTGDKEFLSTYYPTIKKGLDWLLKENDTDGNLLPEGFGMMEIHGLDSEMIDVAAYSQKAFADAAHIAREMGDQALSLSYQQTADRLKQKINQDFWVEEANSYADFIGTKEQALHLIESALVRADTLNKPWAVEELKASRAQIEKYTPGKKQGFVLYHNWVVNTPMEMGIAPKEKALKALETGSRFVNPFGVFVTGIDRDESAGNDEGSFAKTMKIFSYTGAVMTLPTGVQAIAENKYNRPDQALDYLKRMTQSFSYALPGSIYEVSPDFGMVAQAWNIYSYAVPIVTQFFGINPRAQHKIIEIRPQMPSFWNNVSLEHVRIGENSLSMFYRQSPEAVEINIEQQKKDWKIVLSFPSSTYTRWELNGQPIQPQITGDMARIETEGQKISLKLIKK